LDKSEGDDSSEEGDDSPEDDESGYETDIALEEELTLSKEVAVRMHVDVKVLKKDHPFSVDTAASHTLMNYDQTKDLLEKNNIPIRPCKRRVKYADGRKAPIEGVADLELTINRHRWKGPVYLIKGLSSAGVLGLNTMHDLDIRIRVREGCLEFPDSIMKVTKIYARRIRLEASQLEELSENAEFKPSAKEQKIFDKFMARIKYKFSQLRGCST